MLGKDFSINTYRMQQVLIYIQCARVLLNMAYQSHECPENMKVNNASPPTNNEIILLTNTIKAADLGSM